MNHVYIRPLRQDEADVDAFVAAVDNSGKAYPQNVFTLPSTRVMVAEKREEHGIEIIGYMPQFVSLVLGSPVFVSDNANEIASALHQYTANAYTRSLTEGLADVICFTNTDITAEFASRHGFIEAHKALRLEVR